MSLRTAFTRLAIVTAAGALATAAVVTPAGADDGFGSASETGSGFASNGGDFDGNGGNAGNAGNGGGGRGDNGNGNDPGGRGDGNGNGQGGRGDGNGNGNGNGNGQGGQGDNNGGNNQGGQGNDNGHGNNQGNQAGHRLTRGVVTISQLLLHSAPTRGSQVIRVARRGQVVSIYCKTVGQPVQGNRYWYMLTDGTWAWGAARYIDTRGSSPRWC
ncbi:SH3 domain-containing protein [Streptomyces sp. BK239]|uniref:SH3 domain-containing protein n=1 Tax=Streptomyces sp. BK239 TaxID=2512155 RepID=UPI00102AF163|nr:SH3 domain-containing protein [Streptomyces sp. BK239]RZU12727.1 SH3 domain-containing protein [Streptomyces sp. BK239]